MTVTAPNNSDSGERRLVELQKELEESLVKREEATQCLRDAAEKVIASTPLRSGTDRLVPCSEPCCDDARSAPQVPEQLSEQLKQSGQNRRRHLEKLKATALRQIPPGLASAC